MSLKHKQLIQKSLAVLFMLCVLAGAAIIAIDGYVRNYASHYIVTVDTAPHTDAVVVLGAYVKPDGSLSVMLRDRLVTGLELYQQGKAPKIIVSGDHGRKDYDEVNAMKESLMADGAKDEDVFMDHAGFSTYESMYRAKYIFEVKKAVVVTQQYHLYRAIFIARELGIEAYGVIADKQDYGGVVDVYQLREMAARVKDFVYVKILKPEPTYLGEAIPVSGDGRATNDK